MDNLLAVRDDSISKATLLPSKQSLIKLSPNYSFANAKNQKIANERSIQGCQQDGFLQVDWKENECESTRAQYSSEFDESDFQSQQDCLANLRAYQSSVESSSFSEGLDNDDEFADQSQMVLVGVVEEQDWFNLNEEADAEPSKYQQQSSYNLVRNADEIYQTAVKICHQQDHFMGDDNLSLPEIEQMDRTPEEYVSEDEDENEHDCLSETSSLCIPCFDEENESLPNQLTIAPEELAVADEDHSSSMLQL